jgi:hypothetical protein
MGSKNHLIRLPKPHGAKQEAVMSAFFTKGLKEIWVPCGTKFGKSFAAAAAISAKAATSNDNLFRWVAPIYSQTKIGFRYCQKILPGAPHVKANLSEPSLTLAHLGTRIEFKSGKFPEDLEGEACNGYVLDECSKLDEQVYHSARTTTTVTGGSILAVSTPKGKNWFYSKCMEAKEEMEWAIKNGRIPTKLFLTAPSIDNPAVSAETVEEAKRNLPERLFRQYYLAEFVDDGSVFVGFNDCLYGEAIVTQENRQNWVTQDSITKTVVIGVDWAKSKDYTVFVAVDIESNKVIGFSRFHQTPYTEAIRMLVAFSKQFGSVQMVLHDKTGVGMAIDDQLQYTSLPSEGINFSNASKSEMVTKLITSLEQRQLLLPRWQELKSELESFEVSTSATGLMTYGAAPGKHDDIVCALMLANSGLLRYAYRNFEVRILEEMALQPRVISPQEAFLESVINDMDQEWSDNFY